MVELWTLLSHLAEGGEISVFTLDQELSGDISGRLHLAGLLILLVELLHTLLSGRHLRDRQREK